MYVYLDPLTILQSDCLLYELYEFLRKKKFRNEMQNHLNENMRNLFWEYTEGKAPQRAHVGSVEVLPWDSVALFAILVELAGADMGHPDFGGHRWPVPGLRKAAQSVESQLPSPFLSWRDCCQGPEMLIYSLQICGVRSSRKLNPLDTIISASLALFSCGEWPVTPMLLTWSEQLMWGGKPGVGVCPSPAVRMGASGCRWAPPGKHT